MALAISIAVHCEGCVAYHTRAAMKAGANRQELSETVALAVYMGGGPAAVYGADDPVRAVRDLRDQAADLRDIELLVVSEQVGAEFRDYAPVTSLHQGSVWIIGQRLRALRPGRRGSSR